MVAARFGMNPIDVESLPVDVYAEMRDMMNQEARQSRRRR